MHLEITPIILSVSVLLFFTYSYFKDNVTDNLFIASCIVLPPFFSIYFCSFFIQLSRSDALPMDKLYIVLTSIVIEILFIIICLLKNFDFFLKAFEFDKEKNFNKAIFGFIILFTLNCIFIYAEYILPNNSSFCKSKCIFYSYIIGDADYISGTIWIYLIFLSFSILTFIRFAFYTIFVSRHKE
jgi:hypothetical protein